MPSCLSFVHASVTCVERSDRPKTVSRSCPSSRVHLLGLVSETRTADSQPPTAPVSPSIRSALHFPLGESSSTLTMSCPRQEAIRLQQADRTSAETNRLNIFGAVFSISNSCIQLRAEPDWRRVPHFSLFCEKWEREVESKKRQTYCCAPPADALVAFPIASPERTSSTRRFC